MRKPALKRVSTSCCGTKSRSRYHIQNGSQARPVFLWQLLTMRQQNRQDCGKSRKLRSNLPFCPQHSLIIPAFSPFFSPIAPHLETMLRGKSNNAQRTKDGQIDRNGSLRHGCEPRWLHRCGAQDGYLEIRRVQAYFIARIPFRCAAIKSHYPPRQPDRDRSGLL